MTCEVPLIKDAGPVAGGETVLVVDDSRAHRRLMTRTLERWGYAAVEAESGERALEICRSQDIGLVVSDWMMPGISGVEFCRAYREMFRDRPGYIILLTAQTEREVLAEGLESGADDFLSKPVSSIELHARLRAGERVLNAQRALASKNDELTTALERLSDAYSAIDRDLREARLFQEALVPDRHVPLAGMDISLLFQPSGHVGGDMVGYFPIREGELGLYAVDVSGHGVSSALMTARIASYFSSAAPDRNMALTPTAEGYNMIAPDEVCRRLNALLQKDAESDQYLTMVLARISIFTGEVTMCQAGHPSPLVLRFDGGMEFHDSFGMPVGLVDDAEYQSSTIWLGRGDRLLVYSDGLTECPDAAGTLLDEGGLVRILRERSGLRGQALLSGLVDDLAGFSGLRDFPDDLSAFLVERH